MVLPLAALAAGLAAPVFALVDFGAAGAAALVVFAGAAAGAAAGVFAALLFAAIPMFLRGESSTPNTVQDVRRCQTRTTAR
ncbi:MAG TPA: hypothetical protein DIT89_06465 [Planctomycetaceae bacterium]|nr:hypothetical protein [Planctomycetaceae bacterium]